MGAMKAGPLVLALLTLAASGASCALIHAAMDDDDWPQPFTGGSHAGGTGHGGSAAHGGSGGSGGVSFQRSRLLAVHPPIVQEGSRVWLEGEFEPNDTFAHLQDAPQPSIDVRSTWRATIQAPSDQFYTGPLVTQVRGENSAPMPFRVVQFKLGLTGFQDHYPQTSYGRSMPVLHTPLSGHTAHALGNHVYVIGGNGQAELARAWIHADGSLTRFGPAALPSLTQGRSHHAAVRYGPWLYVLGGEQGGATLSSVERFALSPNTDEILDNTALAAELQQGRIGSAAAVIGRYVYVIGGTDSVGAPQPLASVERATHLQDDELGPFEQVSATLNQGRAGHTVEVMGEYLYVIGGRGQSGELRSVERAHILDSGDLEPFETVAQTLVESRQEHASIYLPPDLYVMAGRSGSDLDTVERVSVDEQGNLVSAFAIDTDLTLPAGRSEAACVVAGNEVYLVGGQVAGSPANTVTRSSLVGATSLSEFGGATVSFTEPRANHFSVPASQRLYALGGLGQGGAPVVDMREEAPLNPDGKLAGSFTGPKQWDSSRDGACAAVVADQLYVMGGQDHTGLTPKIDVGPLNAADLEELAEDVSISLPTARKDAACVVLNRRLYTIGGEDDAGPIADVEYLLFDSNGARQNGFQSDVPQLPAPRTGHSVAVLGAKLYVLGGTDGSTPHPDVLVATIDEDGGLSSFAAQTPSGYVTRVNAAAAVVGTWLYLIGGAGAPNPSYVQRAPILDGGDSLGGFAEHRQLQANREHHTAILPANVLLVLGGDTGAGYLDAVAEAQLTGP